MSAAVMPRNMAQLSGVDHDDVFTLLSLTRCGHWDVCSLLRR